MLRSLVAAALLLAVSAAAQYPIYEPDDFVDPALLTAPLFLSRLVMGGAWNPADHYRPIEGNVGLVLITNSLYWKRYQFDYKHTEFLGVDDPPPLQRCDCPDPVYFPTPPPGNATPEGSTAERNDSLQLAFYQTGSSSVRPLTRRYRFTWTRQEIDRWVTVGQQTEKRTGRDQSFTLDADTHVSIRGRELWGTLYVARTSRSGVPDRRAQNEIGYVARPPGWAAGPFLFRTKFTIGGISGRGASGLNVVNPYFEAIYRHEKPRANVHLVWSAEHTRDGAEGWRTNHQVALFVDRTLFVKMLGRE